MVARVFAFSENGVQSVKTVVEIESDLITYYKNKLKISDFPTPDPFKIPYGWMEEVEGMAFWPALSYPDIFNFLMFYPNELVSKDLKTLVTIRIVKDAGIINQDGFNLCNTIIFQKVKLYHQRRMLKISVNKGSIPQTLNNT